MSPKKQAKIKAWQGLHHLGMEEIDIKDLVTMKSVPPDAKSVGEVMFRDNTVMNGYLKKCVSIHSYDKKKNHKIGITNIKAT